MDLKQLSSEVDKEKAFEVLISAGALAAGFLLKKLMEASYEQLYNEDPPNDVKDKEINWVKLTGWTVVSGLAVTSLKVLIKRYAASKAESD